MSLLPSVKSGKSIQPFGTTSYSSGQSGYLVDLSQHQLNHPHVLYASPVGLESGEILEKKDYWKKRLFWKSLDKIYEAYEKQEDWIKALQSPENKLTEHQLDTLGDYYKNPQSGFDKVSHYNEIIVAASRDHIKAIVVPYLHDDQALPHQKKMVFLAGALSGLAHLKQPDPLVVPVVMYYAMEPEYIRPKEGKKNGDFAYIGTGEKELTRASLECLSELQKKRAFSYLKDNREHLHEILRERVTELLHLDIDIPFSKQKKQIQALEAATGLTPDGGIA